MQKAFYEEEVQHRYGLLGVVIALDFAFSAVCLLGWDLVWPLLSEHVVWILGPTFGGGIGTPLEFPFVLIWSLPAAVGLVALLLARFSLSALALPLSILPIGYGFALFGAEVLTRNL